MISKPLLNFLIICFWATILLFFFQLIFSFRAFFLFSYGIVREPHVLLVGSLFFLSTLWMVLFFYTLYFFFKYDRYSKSGLFFLFFHGFYALIYFYRVIWHQKRDLVGSYQKEPVLGNKIFIESDASDEIKEEEQKEYWRQLWLQSIYELTTVEFQKKQRIDHKNENPPYSFGEVLNRYFVDILSDFDYSHYIDIGWISRLEYSIIKEWHSQLVNFKVPNNGDLEEKEISYYTKWDEIVKKGEQARVNLIVILNEKEKKFLMNDADLTD